MRKRGNKSGLASLAPEGARSAAGGGKPQPFAEEDGVASTAFEVTVKVLMSFPSPRIAAKVF